MSDEKTITLQGLARDELIDAIAQRIAFGRYDDEGEERPKSIDGAVTRKLNEMVHARVAAVVTETLGERISALATAEFERMLREGFPKTNNYGERCGTETFEARVRLLLFGERNYGSGLVHEALKKALDRILDQHTLGLIEEAKKRVKEQIDAAVSGKLAEIVRKAVGL